MRPAAATDLPAARIEEARPALLRALERQAAACLEDFRTAVLRRRVRDARRIERYFREMEDDLRRRVKSRGGDPLRAKLQALPEERVRRLEELRAECAVRASLDIVALAAVRVPGVTVELEVRRRKHRRRLKVWYDGHARRWAGLRCDGCGAGATAFAMCDEAEHVYCKDCWNTCGTGGHRRCFRCSGEPERESWESLTLEPISDSASVTVTATSAKNPLARADSELPEASDIPGSSDPEDELRERVLEVIAGQRWPMTSAQIRLFVDVDAAKLRRLLRPLIEDGTVVRLGERRGTRYALASRVDDRELF